tara:strand:+ start:943 stop:1179 length:237 start_codon:yes stop_codon:yes gene_type:complete
MPRRKVTLLPCHGDPNNHYTIRDFKRKGSGSPVVPLRASFIHANMLEPGDKIAIYLNEEGYQIIIPADKQEEFEKKYG